MKGDIYLIRGDLIKAEKEYEKLLEEEEQAAHLWSKSCLATLYLLQGRFENSEDQAKQGIELAEKLAEDGWKSGFHLSLGYLYLRSGNPKEALKEFDEARSTAIKIENITTQIRAIHLKGLSHLEMKSVDEAQKTADELEKFIENWINNKLMRYYYHLMGMIELERDNITKAVEYFEKAISLLSYQRRVNHDRHALFYDSLALVYYKMRNLEKAQEQYERISQLTTGRLIYGDIYAKSYCMLGKVFEEKGWKGKAIEHYEKFLGLWKDADPGIAELEDAKKRLAGLKNVS